MGSDLTFRFAVPGDRYRLGSFLLNEREALNRNSVAGLAQMRDQLVDGTTYLALDPFAGVIGFATITRGTGPANHAGTVRVHVGSLDRGSGVGSTLLRRILSWADDAGLERLVATPYLREDASGAGKVAFFNRHGFELEGVARKFARLTDGMLVDAALMARLHTPESPSSPQS